MIARIAEAVRPFPRAALFELANEGYRSAFEQLVACLISIRTRDEVTLPTARRLFARARSPAAVSALTAQEIDLLIRASSFHQSKAGQIVAIARRVVDQYGGTLPCEDAVVRSFTGVGPKCANLVLGIACGLPRIAVDVHVLRVTNRWGYVHAATPQLALSQLEARLPRRYWIQLNALLVPFGKNICTARLPKCSTCPVLDMCQQQSVTAHR